MAKIKISVTVFCKDEQTAHFIQSTFAPFEKILKNDGVEGISLEWLAEREEK